MNTALVTEEDLKEWLGIKARSKLEEALYKQGIRIIYGKDGRVCTTLDALNGRDKEQSNDSDYII